MGVGAQLRDARKQAGLTIRDISARTKIQSPLLEAIEREDFDRLPGGPVRRGFLRAYAREVRADPESIVRMYLADVEVPSVEPEPRRQRVEPGTLLARALRYVSWLGALAVLFIVIVYTRDDRSATREMEPMPAVGTSSERLATADLPPTGLTGSFDDRPATQPLALDIETTALVWIEAAADGTRVFYRLAEPGERLRFDARKTLAVRFGDAAAFRYSINGQPGRPLGAAGAVVDLHVTPQNYESFRAGA